MWNQSGPANQSAPALPAALRRTESNSKCASHFIMNTEYMHNARRRSHQNQFPYGPQSANTHESLIPPIMHVTLDMDFLAFSSTFKRCVFRCVCVSVCVSFNVCVSRSLFVHIVYSLLIVACVPIYGHVAVCVCACECMRVFVCRHITGSIKRVCVCVRVCALAPPAVVPAHSPTQSGR